MGTVAASRIKRHLLGARSPAGPKVRRALGDKLGKLLGGGDKGGAGGGGAATDAVGTKTPKGTVENGVAAAAGSGASSGLPTVGADGVISMTMHQVRSHPSLSPPPLPPIPLSSTNPLTQRSTKTAPAP